MDSRSQKESALTKVGKTQLRKETPNANGRIGLYCLTSISADPLNDHPKPSQSPERQCLSPPPQDGGCWRSRGGTGSCPIPGADSRAALRLPAAEGGRASLAPGSSAQCEALPNPCRNSGRNFPAFPGEFFQNFTIFSGILIRLPL